MSDESMVTFEEWMAELDATVRSRAGIALVDLPPRHWRDYYDDGVSAEDSFDYYVRDALEELGLHLEIADAFDAADELGFDKLSGHVLAEANLEYVTDGPFDSSSAEELDDESLWR